MRAIALPAMNPAIFQFPSSRAQALKRLADFAPGAGRDYAARRNYDLGPGDRSNVSGLSGAVRHRLVLEEELVRTAIATHGLRAAEKFVQEVCWRTYWKGWLEMRPAVWARYRRERDDALADLDTVPSLRRRYEAAIGGRTGIACFDAWAGELIDHGYLHNHARMWFASIWIYTLNLPWTLGADHFLRHLIDGDAASNTLSWRWVGGLHTRGKTYLARADNIAAFTGGRFDIDAGQLAASAPALCETGEEPACQPLQTAGRPDPSAPTLLLLHEEDLHQQSWPVDGLDVRGIASLDALGWRSPMPIGEQAQAFTRHAIADAAERAGAQHACPVTAIAASGSLAGTAAGCGASQIVTMRAMTGPLKDRLDAEREALAAAGIGLVELRHDWDVQFHPHARRGFFKLKEAIPGVLTALGIN
ncbi:MAG: Deoxyribodipyrimidine photolyase [Oceanicaulis sp. HLUCCA04]|nr:MAG: Deoxyribodipyrimidine photolyase [Oceanicaulis sp. HLUCCA04]